MGRASPLTYGVIVRELHSGLERFNSRVQHRMTRLERSCYHFVERRPPVSSPQDRSGLSCQRDRCSVPIQVHFYGAHGGDDRVTDIPLIDDTEVRRGSQLLVSIIAIRPVFPCLHTLSSFPDYRPSA